MSLLIAFVMKYYTFARCSRSARIYLTTTQTTSFCPTKLPQTLLYNTQQHPNARKFNVVLHRSYLFFFSREKYRYLVFEEDDTICSFGDDDDDDDDDALDVVDDSPPKVAVGATRTTTTTTTNASGVRARDGRKRAR
jgi:hypothetical protein